MLRDTWYFSASFHRLPPVFRRHDAWHVVLVSLMSCVGQEPVEASGVPRKRQSFVVSKSWLEAAAQVRLARVTCSILLAFRLLK